MPLNSRASVRNAKMQTALSTWTPLNHPQSNSKVFEERRNLLAKWFDRWSDSQRKAVLQDLVMVCSVDQLMFLSNSVSRRLPLQAADFTCLLPRVLCLYLFSFLDPRSLCRCAQVTWHWKGIVELDQLWMPKCVRLGWYINFSPTPFEQGVWKRHYILTVKELRLSSLQVWRSASSQQQFTPAHVPDVSRRHEALSEPASAGTQHPGFSSKCLRGTSRKKQPAAPPPWRGSDRSPKDTLRFNYLDNTDSTGPAVQEKMKIRPSSSSSSWKPGDVSKRSISETNYKLRKAKSLVNRSPFIISGVCGLL